MGLRDTIIPMANVQNLPNELICILSSYLPAVDVVNLLSTCKALRVFITEETIWRRFCAQYGVIDPANLCGTSFFQVYSGMLHTYGPIIGLWASDSPFTGSIIEFRIDEQRNAIVGEAWMHYMKRDQKRPILPYYYLFATIELSPSKDNSPMVSWLAKDELCVQGDPELFPALYIMSETNATIYYRDGTTFSEHPPFPKSTDDVWYDRERELPRLKLEPSPAVHTPPPTSGSPPTKYMPGIYTSIGPTAKPRALCIRSALDTNASEVLPVWLIPKAPARITDYTKEGVYPSPNGVDGGTRRFYPLRSDTRNGQLPDHRDWHPASIEGLWLGEYPGNGMEVLWLTYDAKENTISAWKVTGDANVPRGVISWTIKFNERWEHSDVRHTRIYNMYPSARAYHGSGTICRFCFM
jgi:hypothetical protein